MSTQNPKFVAGDVVMLNSGGPEMTVLKIMGDGSVLCEWFDKNDVRQEHSFLESNIGEYSLPLPFSI